MSVGWQPAVWHWITNGHRGHGYEEDDIPQYWMDGVLRRHRARTARSGIRRQLNPDKRHKIEQTAIRVTTKHYKKLGYEIDSVERDNVGWDLNATVNGQILRLEVKGLSQGRVSVELTPNEYRAMKRFRNSYNICAVTKALTGRPLLKIFSFFSREGGMGER